MKGDATALSKWVEGSKQANKPEDNEEPAKQRGLDQGKTGVNGTKPETVASVDVSDTTLTEAYKGLYVAQANTTSDSNGFQMAQEGLQAALKIQGKANMKQNKDNVQQMANMSKTEKLRLITGMIKDTESQLDMLKTGLQAFAKSNVAVPAIQDVKTEHQGDGAEGKKELVTTNYSTAEDRWADPRKLFPEQSLVLGELIGYAGFNLSRNGLMLPPSVQQAKPSK